jgi:hypothetical protein
MNARKISRIRLALACLMTLAALAAPRAALAQPVGPLYESRFDAPADISAWTVASGVWEVANGRFVHGSGGPMQIATVHSYQMPQLIDATARTMGPNFAIDLYASIRGASSDARAGVVFNFNDPGNYYVLLFSAAGEVQLNSVVGGAVTPLATGSFGALGVGRWTHIRIVRSHDTTSVQMDGKPVMANVQQAGLPDGEVGLLGHRTSAFFDDLSVLDADAVPAPFYIVDTGYLEDFGDRVADRWQSRSGSWAVVGGEYRSTAADRTAITLSEIPAMLSVVWSDRYAHYTVRTRMLNRYRGSGNRIGVVIGYRDAQNYHEVVFSPVGDAMIRTVSNGVVSTLARGTYVGAGQNKWFDVEIAYVEIAREGAPTLASVRVNGRPVFDSVVLPWAWAAVGFVTHWSLASFDDVRASGRRFQPYADDFENENPINYGNWQAENGTLRGSVASRVELFDLPSWHDFMDVDVRAWMVNHYGSTGNLVGIAYGVRNDSGFGAGEGNYFEVVFSPTGSARLNRVIQGQSTTIAAAPYRGGGAHRWFNVQLLQRQSYTTVKVNGATVFANVYQPDAMAGWTWLVTHWSVAEYDDVSLQQVPR